MRDDNPRIFDRLAGIFWWFDERMPEIYELYFNEDSTGYAVGSGNTFFRFYPGGLGDLNNDKSVDVLDLLKFLLLITQEEPPFLSTADLDGSGKLDVFDLLEMLRLMQ